MHAPPFRHCLFSAGLSLALLLAPVTGRTQVPPQAAEATGAKEAKEADGQAPRGLDFSNAGFYPPAVRAPTEAEAATVPQRMEEFREAVDALDLARAHRVGDGLVALLDASYGPEHPLRAEFAGVVGWGYFHAGDPVAAVALLKPAVAVLDKAHGSFNPSARMAARALLMSMLQADDQMAARAALDQWPLVRLSGPRVSRLDGDSDIDYASDLEVAAAYTQVHGLPERALEMRREVLALRERTMGPDSVAMAQALDLLAGSLLQYGLADEAEPLASRSLAIREARHGAQSYLAAASLATLGRIRAARGRTAEGEAMLRRALQLHRERLGEASPLVEDVSADLARMLAAQGRHEEAMAIWTPLVAARAQSKVAGPKTLEILLGIADAAEALDACEQTAAMLGQMASNADDMMWIPSLTGLRIHEAHARNLYCRGEHQRAADEYEATAFGLLGLFDGSHPEFGLMQARMALLVGGDDATLGKAEAAVRNAVGVANERRRLLQAGSSAAARALAGGSDPMALAFQAQLYVSWRRLQVGNPNLDQGREGEPMFAGTYRNEGFVAAQDFDYSGAARALAQTAARTAAGSGPLAARVRHQQDLVRRAVDLDRQLAAVVGSDPAAAKGLRERFAQVVAELGAVDQALAGDFPDYARMVTPAALPVREVQSRLAADEGLLLLVPVARDVHAFAVSAAGVKWHRLEGRAGEVARDIGRLRCQLDPATCGEAAANGARGVASVYGQATAQGGRGFDRGVAHALYRDLVAPVEGVLAGVDRLFVVASGPLGGLPLGVLVAEAPLAGEDDASPDVLARTAWLADRYAMVTLPAVSSLQAAAPVAGEAPMDGGAAAFLGFGAPVLEGSTGAVRGGGPVFAVADGDGLGLADPATIRALAPLPGTRRELDAMAALFGAQATVSTGAGATEAAFKRAPRLGDATVLAFATHGLLPREVRGLDEPGLVFTPPRQASREDDGVLTASEAAGLDLRADWLILSACNTAAADGTPGAESLSGLARAFLYAGAQSLLASHWRVSDDATAALTVETLSAWRGADRPTRAQALQQAMRALRSGRRADGTPLPGWKPQWTHPSAWAPFVVISASDR